MPGSDATLLSVQTDDFFVEELDLGAATDAEPWDDPPLTRSFNDGLMTSLRKPFR